MTFLFLDKVAGIVGLPDALVAEARDRVFEGSKPQGTRDEVRAYVASTVVGVANDKLRQPLIDAVDAHAQEIGDAYCMMTGEEPGSDGYRAAVIAAFDGNDCGIDMDALPHGGATPEAVADQVLVVPKDEKSLWALMDRLGLYHDDVSLIVDEIFTPAQITWSLDELAALVQTRGQKDGNEHEMTEYLLSADPELRETGFKLLGRVDASLDVWLDERAMFSSPEQDEADVAEVLRLINQKGGGSHTGLNDDAAAADMTAAGAEPDSQFLAVHDASLVAEQPAPVAASPKPLTPAASEPSDVTRAVAAALKTLFEMTKESDTHVAEVLGVPKVTVAQSRKDVTPWAPDADQMGRLRALVGRYNDALAAAAGALNALEEMS